MKKTIYLSLCALLTVMLYTSKASAQTIGFDEIINNCDSETFIVAVTDSAPTLSLTTYFGDGASGTYSAATGDVEFGHTYAAPGMYTVKYVLYNSGVATDSVTVTDSVGTCHLLSLVNYLDNNSDCIFDGGDDYVMYPIAIEIDSSGVPLDTITATSLYYTALGTTGTIYTFKDISAPSGLVFSCPTSGIVHDTIGTSRDRNYIGFNCGTTTGYNLTETVSKGGPGRHMADYYVTVANEFCTAHAGTLTMTFSPQYDYDYATPTPTSVVGNVITWDFAGLSEVAPQYVHAHVAVPGAWLIPGDTIHSSFILTPSSGAYDTVYRIDTVTSSYDPNCKSVTPSGYITAGTNLDYSIMFENTGNAPAVNIHIQDTLSNDLDINSFKLQSTTAPVYTYISKNALGQNVLKFDFQNINLLDSSHHGQCFGTVTFTINSKAGLAPGTVINNHAGIYFDDNPVVMTDTTFDIIATPTSVSKMGNAPSVLIYPDPVNDVLTIQAGVATYNSLTITNTLGQVVKTQQFNAPLTNVDVKTFTPGIYYIMLKGDSGITVQKFEKL